MAENNFQPEIVNNPKAPNSKTTSAKVIFWILLIVVLTSVLTFYEHKLSSRLGVISGTGTNNVPSLTTDKNPDNSQKSGNTYRNTRYNFKIEFPENWKIEECELPYVVQKATFERCTISVLVEQLDFKGKTSLSSIKSTGSIKDYLAHQGLTENSPDIEMLKYGETNINNEPSYWAEYYQDRQISDKKIKMAYFIYFFAKDDAICAINLGAPADDYPYVKPLFLKSVASFVFENHQ